MKILHLNAGNETGGGMHHILALLQAFNRDQFILGVLEKGELLRRADAAEIQTVHFASNTRLSIPQIRKIKHYIKQNKINVIHTHGPRANVYANILRKIVPFEWIVTVHSNPLHDFMGKGIYGNLLCKLNINAVKHADKLIIISEPLRNSLTDAGVRGEKIITAFNGIDFREKAVRAHNKTDFGFAKGDFIFLMVARLEHVKGHHIALEAFSELISKKRKCHIVLLGEGTLKDSLERLAKKLGISDYVHFMGHRDDAESFYLMADITMLTSFSEGFPLVLLESARAKTPVIATNVGSVKEIILNKSVGWKIQPGNVHELAAAMEDALFLYGRGMLSIKGQRLQEHAANKFTIESFAENVYNVYLSIGKSNGM